MKKILCILLCLCMLIPLAACGGEREKQHDEKEQDLENDVGSDIGQNTGSGSEIGSDQGQNAENCDYHIKISSGSKTIYPFGCIFWSRTENEDGTFTETEIDKYDVVDLVSGKSSLSVTNIPFLHLEGSVSYTVQANGNVKKVYVITDAEGEYTKKKTTFDALSNLADGIYYVVLEVLINDVEGSACYEDVFCLIVGDPIGFDLFRYTWDGWGISTKSIVSYDIGYRVGNALRTMKETGETVSKISDDVLKIGGGEYPIERGTMWIECDDKIYRLTPDLSQICLVETHFGAGKVLEMTDAFKSDIAGAWQYYPYDYYLGTYNKGDKAVELKNVFKADSSIGISVKDIYVESEWNPKNTITIELVSTEDQSVRVNLDCSQSEDNLAEGDTKTVELKKDVPQTVELSFGGWPSYPYWIYINAGNTNVNININPLAK